MKPTESTVELTYLGKGPFKVHKHGGRGTVGNAKPMCKNHRDLKVTKNHRDSKVTKAKFGQVKAETSCQRNVPMSRTVQVDRSRGKDSKGRDNPIVRQVEKKPRQRESSKVNQVSTIRKSQQGWC
ncbi:hypothetical protein J1N35_030997 [Gossypium stocksii]|uniref:Uncharacterized protein n=1 Tax=Gossypium stocksii TaxID=47602 RepID=A0A9D3ZUX3_9ROSI|nr:hypothetical protein J1N35_030997 [Gossypium stocksii]